MSEALPTMFWLCAGLAAYTMLVYPVLSLMLAAIVNRRIRKGDFTPKVSFLIAAYNEEAAIAEKLEQTLALDYPPDDLEILVVSDGSTDRTDEIVRSFAGRGVKLHRVEDRRGKTHAVNEAVAHAATGEIVIFSDATGEFSARSVRELAANFADERVGCVTGRVVYRYGTSVNARGFRLYQKLAVAIRQAEHRFGSQTSVSGAIHAIRRELYRPANPAHSLDVIDAVHTVAQGRLVTYERAATAHELSRERLIDEFRSRVRIGVRGTSMIPYILGTLVRRRRWLYLFQMVSHKILRWWLWLPLAGAWLSSIALSGRSSVYLAAAALQTALYAVGALGASRGGKQLRLPGFSVVTFFVMGNAAMALGAMKTLAGKRMAKWEPIR